MGPLKIWKLRRNNFGGREIVRIRCRPIKSARLRILCAAPQKSLLALQTIDNSSGTQVQPPGVCSHPLPLFEQHQLFFGIDHPRTQLANPASQSNGSDVVHPPPPLSQPFPWTRQHHAFLVTDQPVCQLANPSKQLNGSAGAGAGVGSSSQMWWILQHHSFLSGAHCTHASTAQLKGSTGPGGGVGGVGDGAWVGGGVGGGVGKGVGGTVGVVSGRAVVGLVVPRQPRPNCSQQYFCFAIPHEISQFSKPWLQSMPLSEQSHHSRQGSNNRRGTKQHPMMTVKSLLRLTTSKSPP